MTLQKKGYALCIGVKEVNPDFYGGNKRELDGPENDVKVLSTIAEQQGFAVTKLLTQNATIENVIKEIKSLTEKAKAGDYVLITYSGHGGQVKDENNDEEDGLDETWLLYNKEFIDDQLHELLAEFQEGVRVLVLADSCHSGTIIDLNEGIPKPDGSSNSAVYEIRKSLNKSDSIRNSKSNSSSNIENLKNSKGKEKKAVTAAVVQISGCGDSQLSFDGTSNGLFTEKLKFVWSKGKYQGNLREFYQAIKEMVIEWNVPQTPELVSIGNNVEEFLNQRPFTI